MSSSAYADLQLHPIQHVSLYLQQPPDFHNPHKTPSNISQLTLGSLYFLQGSCFLPSCPCTLASLRPLTSDPLIPICTLLTYVGDIQCLNMRPSIVLPLTKGVSNILFSFNEVFKIHIWPREFQIFLFCYVWSLY